MIRVLVVDDQRLMREGLRTLLALEEDLEIVDIAADGAECLALIRTHDIDVVLMDIRMPQVDGITAVKQLRADRPALRVLMLTTFDDQEDIVAALSAGAAGYLLKDMPSEEIAAAIRTAHAGGAVLPPHIAQTFLDAVQSRHMLVPTQTKPMDPPSDALTDREGDVLQCLARGMSNREIAEALYVTEGTVKNHVSNLITKLGLRDRTQVALYAVRSGYQPPR